jgi:hypothetical protein
MLATQRPNADDHLTTTLRWRIQASRFRDCFGLRDSDLMIL